MSMQTRCLASMFIGGLILIGCGISSESYMAGHPHEMPIFMMKYVPWQNYVMASIGFVLFLLGMFALSEEKSADS